MTQTHIHKISPKFKPQPIFKKKSTTPTTVKFHPNPQQQNFTQTHNIKNSPKPTPIKITT